MMADLTRQYIDLSQLDDDKVIYTYDTNGDITGLTHLFVLNDLLGAFVFSVAGTTTDPGSVSTPGVVEFDLTGEVDTLHQGNYVFEMHRTTASNKQMLAFGYFLVHRILATT